MSFSRGPSESPDHQHHQRYPPHSRTGFSGPHYHHHSFDGPPPPLSSSVRPMGGGDHGRSPPSLSGQKRGAGGFDRGISPDRAGGGSFAKLFVGSVPRTATEEDIRPLFEEYGHVVEVALIKDKRTGQQQGCCFIKYSRLEEANRAIGALHNRYTLPGGLGPIQVRYADGERERLGAIEYKLFVGSLNRQASEKEIEDIFSPYGHVEDVYIMKDDLKQSRGCGFVKFSHREMALAAINALNGTYVMRGCDQPLTVRFADPKRPRIGEARPGPPLVGPGSGQRSQMPQGIRSNPNVIEPMGSPAPNMWHPMSGQGLNSPSQVGSSALDNHSSAKNDGGSVPSTAAASMGILSGPTNGSLQGVHATQSTMNPQCLNPTLLRNQPFGQQMASFQKPLQSPRHFPPSFQVSQQIFPTSQASSFQVQPSHSMGHTFSHQSVLPSQFGLGQLPISQPKMQHISATSPSSQLTHNQQGMVLSQQPLPSFTTQQPQSMHHPSVSIQHQTQSLQPSFQTQSQAFSHFQQQSEAMQTSSQNITQNLSTLISKQELSGILSQTAMGSVATLPATVVGSTVSSSPVVPVVSQSVAPLTCNWTEHTSPEGYKYYYNSVTCESKWEKPEELTLFEQMQQKKGHQKHSSQDPQTNVQNLSNVQVHLAQQISQKENIQLQAQFKQLQNHSLSSTFQTANVSATSPNAQNLAYTQPQSVNPTIDGTRFKEVAQDWMWRNKPAGI